MSATTSRAARGTRSTTETKPRLRADAPTLKKYGCFLPDGGESSPLPLPLLAPPKRELIPPAHCHRRPLLLQHRAAGQGDPPRDAQGELAQPRPRVLGVRQLDRREPVWLLPVVRPGRGVRLHRLSCDVLQIELTRSLDTPPRRLGRPRTTPPLERRPAWTAPAPRVPAQPPTPTSTSPQKRPRARARA